MNFKTFLLIVSLYSSIKYSICSDSLKKHVVVIVADDLGWNDLSFHGSNQFPTPNIDALAYSGTILQNYYVMPLCSPSRSALMTGMHPIRTGMFHRAIHAPQPTGLPLDIKILPQYLKEYGYRTHIVGKWHLGFCKAAYTPTRRGFDSHFGFWAGHEDYFTHVDESDSNTIGYDLRRNMDSVPLQYQEQYSTDIFTTEAVNIIDSHDPKEPLFLYIAHQAVHSANEKTPLQAPQDIINKFKYIADKSRRIFAAMVWKLDESVGEVVQALARKNMLENTMIIFTTDNGGMINAASNWALKGMKSTVWEGGLRGAAFIWSADLPHFTVNNALMHIQDWLPTILGAIDNQVNSTFADLNGLDGRNMWPVLKGEKPSEYDELLLQKDQIDGVDALRNENWKVIRVYKPSYIVVMQISGKSFGPSGRGMKYTYNITDILRSPTAEALQTQFPFPEENQILSLRRNISFNCNYCGINDELCTPCVFHNGPCLFDIANDPCERNNLAGKYPSVLQDMLNRMERYTPAPARFPPFSAEANPKYWNNTWTNWLDYTSKEYIILVE